MKHAIPDYIPEQFHFSHGLYHDVFRAKTLPDVKLAQLILNGWFLLMDEANKGFIEACKQVEKVGSTKPLRDYCSRF